MTPIDKNSNTQTIIQTSTTGGSDNGTPNQGGSGTNQGTNQEKQQNIRGRKHKNGGDNK